MDNKQFGRDFTLVVIGQIISLLGSAMLRFALNLYVLDLTGRADVFGAVIAISSIPAIVFSPIGGAIADRFNRRNLMVIFDFSSCTIIIITIILMGIIDVPVMAIGFIMAVLAIIGSMYQPAVQASVPTLVHEDRLAAANGIVNGVGALSGLLGPVLGGILYGIIGLKTLIIISGIAFFLSAIMEIFIRIPFTKRITEKHIIAAILQDTRDGFHYIARDNPFILKISSLAASLNLFFTPLFIIGTPYILRVIMKSNDIMYGIGLGLLQFSTIVGALLVGPFSKKLRASNIYFPFIVIALLFLPMALAVSPAFSGFGFWPSFILFFVVSVIVLVLSMIVSIFIITDIQKVTPNEMMGKVMAIIMTISQIASPLGQILFGFMLQAAGKMVYVPVLLTSLFTLFIAFGAKRLLSDENN